MSRLIHRYRALRALGHEAGQVALILVIGVLLITAMGTTLLITQTTQTYPIIQNNLAQHYAYRAVQAGINEYEYEIQTDPNLVLCSSLTASTPACSQLLPFKFGVWNQVPNSGLGGSPAEYYAVSPTLDVADGVVKVTVDGAANAGNATTYESANVTFTPTNSFVQNAWWSVHEAVDPTVWSSCGLSQAVEQAAGKPSLVWGDGINGANDFNSSGCTGNNSWWPLGTQFNGSVFSDDPVVVNTFGDAPNLNTLAGSIEIGTASPWSGINTADPYTTNQTVNNDYVYGGPLTDLGMTYTAISNYVHYNSAKSTIGNAIQLPPNAVSAVNSLTSVAKENGCVYSGPTSITFDGTNANTGVGQVLVNSPDTPLSNGKDADNDLIKNSNTCIGATTSTPVPIPTDGLMIVQGATPASGQTTCTSNAAVALVGSYYGESSTPTCEGNAIVGNANYNASNSSLNVGLSGSLTIAAANNIVIDNSITYDDCGSTAPGNLGASSCQINDSANNTANDVLGLIGTNYVELNHPATAANNQTFCSVATNGNTSGGLNCVLKNPRLDAVVLALQHDFAVNNAPDGLNAGTIQMNGAMDQYWADMEGVAYSPTDITGYMNDYNWDARLAIISPPYYLTPGTQAWGIGGLAINTAGKSSVAPAGP